MMPIENVNQHTVLLNMTDSIEGVAALHLSSRIPIIKRIPNNQMLVNITEESKSIIYHLPQVVNTDECIESAQDIERFVGWQRKQHQWK